MTFDRFGWLLGLTGDLAVGTVGSRGLLLYDLGVDDFLEAGVGAVRGGGVIGADNLGPSAPKQSRGPSSVRSQKPERVGSADSAEPSERKAQAPGKPQGAKVSSADSAEQKGDTRDKVSKALGVGHTKYDQAKKVVNAAEAGDPVAQEAVEEMDRTGNVHAAHRIAIFPPLAFGGCFL